jgi:hypothetical protein
VNATIRLKVFDRAKGYCECGCRRPITFETGRADHFFGRAKVEEKIANVWALAIPCDELKTNNRPSSIYWFRLFRDHCRKHRYEPEFERAQTRIMVLKQKGLVS